MDDKTIRKMEERFARLEKAVFGSGAQRGEKSATSKFSGPTGGVRFLISKNFFTAKKELGEVRKALADNGYHYSRQAVHVALKGLATRRGPLAVLKEGGMNVYVNRK
jgi:hypothetical protein